MIRKAILLAAVMSSGALAKELLCERSEVSLFWCDTGNETISVCSSSTLDLLQYRAKDKNGGYFVFPQRQGPSEGGFRYSSMGGSGWGDAHLTFTHKGRTYVVADEWSDKTPPAVGTTYRREVLVLNPGGVPGDGEEAVYKQDRVYRTYRCKKSSGHLRNFQKGKVASEEFIYLP
jgi:hypothetical protein